MAQKFDSDSFSFSQQLAVQSFIQKVYSWMAAGLLLTGLVSLWTASTPAVMQMLARGAFWVLAIAEIGLVFWLSASIHKISAQAASTAFLIYSALNGLTLSWIFLIYTASSIATVFFITAGTFAAVSLFGWTTKADLSSLRGYMVMALIGLVIASVVNMFIQSTPFYWILSYAGVAIFIGLTAYDTQRLKELHYTGGGSSQMAIQGALMLYLDFINMFIYLLRIFGRRRD